MYLNIHIYIMYNKYKVLSIGSELGDSNNLISKM